MRLLKSMLGLMLLAAVPMAGSLLSAAEPEKPAAAAAPPVGAPPVNSPASRSAQTEETAAPATPAIDATKPADKSAPAASAADKSSPQRFIPSEQVRADFDVSFPVDI
jgi:hypothetical protein